MSLNEAVDVLDLHVSTPKGFQSNQSLRLSPSELPILVLIWFPSNRGSLLLINAPCLPHDLVLGVILHSASPVVKINRFELILAGGEGQLGQVREVW